MSNSKKFGYGRVSGKDQNEARQLEAFKKEGILERDIYIDKKSGKDFDRTNYKLLKNLLREDDLLVIPSIDRLGRNYQMIVDEWRDITKNIKADILVLDMPILDTRQKKDLIGTLINDIILALLSYVAQVEREKIRSRQREGIDVCFSTKKTKTGRWFGRPRVPKPENFEKWLSKWLNKEITAREFMKETNLKPNTFYNFVKDYINKSDK